MGAGNGGKDVNEAVAEFQRCAREMLKAQQDAFLAAVKAWRGGVGQAPVWPQGGAPGLAPKPEELAEASYALAAKLLADQSRFMQELSKAMASRDDNKD
jgi:hypothetical protein